MISTTIPKTYVITSTSKTPHYNGPIVLKSDVFNNLTTAFDTRWGSTVADADVACGGATRPMVVEYDPVQPSKSRGSFSVVPTD